ncbi:MAG: hypothetical protein K0Q60_2292 [Microvirga sp.]|jgi:hypothetical protein|nr:hypothetical protein [Microvirga sp.]
MAISPSLTDLGAKPNERSWPKAACLLLGGFTARRTLTLARRSAVSDSKRTSRKVVIVRTKADPLDGRRTSDNRCQTRPDRAPDFIVHRVRARSRGQDGLRARRRARQQRLVRWRGLSGLRSHRTRRARATPRLWGLAVPVRRTLERGWHAACARMPSDLRAARSRTRAARLPHRNRPDLSMLPARMLVPKTNRWRCSPTEPLVRAFPPLNAGFRALITQLWPNSVRSPVGRAKPT